MSTHYFTNQFKKEQRTVLKQGNYINLGRKLAFYLGHWRINDCISLDLFLFFIDIYIYCSKCTHIVLDQAVEFRTAAGNVPA